MKKIVVVVAVLVLALVVAPWGVGKLAEKRLDVGIDKVVEQAPYLKVVDRKWTRGWFKSEQTVTFEAFSSWIDAMNPKAIEDAMKKEAAEATAVEPSGEPTVAAATDAVPPSDDPPADESPAPVKPQLMRFTIRNEVWHGPVLGLSGLGIARVKTHLVLSEDTQKKLVEIFGPKDPIEIVTRVGFTGGGTTTFTSEGRTIKPDAKSEVSWETFKLAIGYSRDADKYDMDGKWPKVTVTNSEEKSKFVMTDMKIDGVGKRISGDIYDTDFNFEIDKLDFLAGSGERVEVARLHYIVESDAKDEFLEINAKVGTGEVKNKELASLGVELEEIHYDFSMRRLHIETLAKMMAGMKAAYAKPLTSAVELNKVVFAPLKEQGLELLKYDPEFSIDRIGIVTPDGDGYLKGVVKLKGVTAEDFAGDSMALIGKVHADLTIDVSEKMVQKFPNGSTAAGAAVDSGYAQRKGDRLICRIVFADGALTVNGKPQAIPGLGGPPAASTGESTRPAE
jgi:uncharacterized protein YdgA (DUF945 family)